MDITPRMEAQFYRELNKQLGLNAQSFSFLHNEDELISKFEKFADFMIEYLVSQGEDLNSPGWSNDVGYYISEYLKDTNVRNALYVTDKGDDLVWDFMVSLADSLSLIVNDCVEAELSEEYLHALYESSGLKENLEVVKEHVKAFITAKTTPFSSVDAMINVVLSCYDDQGAELSMYDAGGWGSHSIDGTEESVEINRIFLGNSEQEIVLPEEITGALNFLLSIEKYPGGYEFERHFDYCVHDGCAYAISNKMLIWDIPLADVIQYAEDNMPYTLSKDTY